MTVDGPQASAKDFERGPLAFMVRHPVAANLLMIIFLVGGLIMTQEIRQEVFPDHQLHEIRINVSYSGASPEDVETALVQPVEDAVQNIPGVDNFNSISREGGGRVTVEVVGGANEVVMMSKIQAAVDGIRSLPDGVNRPTIRFLEQLGLFFVPCTFLIFDDIRTTLLAQKPPKSSDEP